MSVQRYGFFGEILQRYFRPAIGAYPQMGGALVERLLALTDDVPDRLAQTRRAAMAWGKAETSNARITSELFVITQHGLMYAAKRLRDAMDRLLVGRPQRTDGRLIKDNLWKEADVSRATMNRAAHILAEWNSRVAECEGFTPGEARKSDEITTLRTKLTNKIRECSDLHHQLDAAATAIAALHHDNSLLRQELDR